ncbi:MAG TPA: ATP-binding protein [Bacteroidota bacterium]|nr:ATP-binding protein [Bacteroidota bacterium]
MLYTIVALSYSVANVVLAIMILFKYRQALLSKFYLFCVGCLLAVAFLGWYLPQAQNETVRVAVRSAAVFLYSVFPFFFIHFVVIFVRRYEILRSKLVVAAIYFTGLFSYTMILLGLIPEPILPDGSVAESGFIFFLTWMTIFFTIGIAMLYEIARGFYEKVGRANLLLASFILLLLLLPGPFTETLFFDILDVGSAGYYVSSMIAVAVAVYFIFRHKIIVNTFYDSLKSALSVINDVILTTNEDLQIEMVTGGVTSLLGYGENELQGKMVSQYFVPADRLSGYRESVLGGKTREGVFDVDFIRKDGERVAMNFSFMPMKVNEQVTGFVGVGRDITERRRIEEKLRERDRLEGLGTLAAGVAHDFNNILQVLLMNNSGPGSDSQEARSRRDEINKSAIDRGKNLVKQILTFARKTPVKFHQVEINALVRECTKMLSNTFPKTVSIRENLRDGIPPVNADETQLTQILLNLCVNARDAMPDGGQITITSAIIGGTELVDRFPDARPGAYVRLSVTDTGSGMSEEVRKRIFEPFYTTKGRGKGTGLGLAVVYGIVGTHGGFIDVKSRLGEGTTFETFLPSSAGLPRVEAPVQNAPPKLQAVRRTILIVEDEELILSAVMVLLRERGFDCIPAKDGAEALQKWDKYRERISVILLDVDLPKINGWDVLLRIRNTDPDVKIILCSGFLDPEMKKVMTEGGASDYIGKPYEIQDVLTSLDRVFEGESVAGR